jgi:hypothetical protein
LSEDRGGAAPQLIQLYPEVDQVGGGNPKDLGSDSWTEPKADDGSPWSEGRHEGSALRPGRVKDARPEIARDL